VLIVRKFTFLILVALILFGLVQTSSAGFFDDLLKKVTGTSEPGEETLVSGLKEALDIGTRNAVNAVSKEDGYFGNLDIRIPVPPKLEKAESALRRIGLGKQVDEFVLSMNRAAEGAAPQAVDIFVKAIGDMTVVDAYGIVKGDETAGTEYFREKTSDELTGLFRPFVTESLASVGTVSHYKKLVEIYNSLPLVKKVEVDLEEYVTMEALDGLFFMVGEEEKKIRTDPAARVTELLQKVFGN
jgi:hypothetical protein